MHDARKAAGRALDRMEAELEQRAARRAPPAEIAFYGGTFTAQPEPVQTACLQRLLPRRARGEICAVRCSTRPDAFDAAGLARLKALGLGTVELGVQSFSSRALAGAGRGYDRECALKACALVREAGLNLGVQLMPGMPGAEDEDADGPGGVFQDDVRQALESRADFLRVYPCLVIEGTELARMLRLGRYKPWTPERAVRETAAALLAAGARGIPVIRMGLPLDRTFAPHILAGPAHPALGSLAQAEALFMYLAPHLAGGRAAGLRLPARCRGFFWGERGGMRRRWADLGLHDGNVLFADEALDNDR